MYCRLSAISVSGDGGMNPFEDGCESMWESAGEEDDCDFADDRGDGKNLADPEVKELMSEIMGEEEADQVLDQGLDSIETFCLDSLN